MGQVYALHPRTATKVAHRQTVNSVDVLQGLFRDVFESCVVQLFAWMPCLKTLRRLCVSARGSPQSRMRTGAGPTRSELDEARKTSEKVSPPPPLPPSPVRNRVSSSFGCTLSCCFQSSVTLDRLDCQSRMLSF